MPPKSCGEEVAESAGTRMIHDVGSDIKVPLPMFSLGSARLGAYATSAGLSTVLEVAEAQTTPISMLLKPYEWETSSMRCY